MLEKIKNKIIEKKDTIVKGAIGFGATILGVFVAGKLLSTYDGNNEDFIELEEDEVIIKDPDVEE